MKITSVEATALRSSAEVQRTSTQEIKNRQSCIVQIHTDDGLIGIGDAQRPESPEAMCYLIKDLFSPLLIGKDPLDWNVLGIRCIPLKGPEVEPRDLLLRQ